MFVPNPSHAIANLDDNLKQKRWFRRKSGTKKKDSTSKDDTSIDDDEESVSSSKSSNKPLNAPPKSIPKAKKPSAGFPSTSITKDTMRPTWKREHVHFALKTHTDSGHPIDFAGAQLHVSLIDSKTGAIIGSHCLNLAHLIIISREKVQLTPAPTNHKRGVGALNSSSFKNQAYQFAPNPSKALQYTRHNEANKLPPAVQKAANSLKGFVDESPNNLFKTIAADLGSKGSGKRSSQRRDTDKYGIKSLRLNEVLIEGGLVIGHIKCSIDIWWMGEE
jgi:hypothetical protein